MYRSPLFVPADRPAMLAKAASRGSDLIVIDLEDAVPRASKSEARRAVIEAVPALRDEGASVAVRINSIRAERVLDIESLEGVALDAVMVPKATAGVIDEVASASGLGDVDLVALIESGRGVLDAPRVADHARVGQLAIGEADLAADLDMEAGDDDPAWLPSRMRLVWASSGAQLAGPIGPVWIDLADLDGLRESTKRLKAIGFAGRLAIHPAQVPVITEVFQPTEDELRTARDHVAAYDAAVATGRGVIVDESGKIVDEALVRRARRMVADHGEG